MVVNDCGRLLTPALYLLNGFHCSRFARFLSKYGSNAIGNDSRCQLSHSRGGTGRVTGPSIGVRPPARQVTATKRRSQMAASHIGGAAGQVRDASSQVEMATRRVQMAKHGIALGNSRSAMAPHRAGASSILDCGSPLPLSPATRHSKAPEDWRSPKPVCPPAPCRPASHELRECTGA